MPLLMPRVTATNHQIRDRVARRLRDARLAKGWSQARLAEALGITTESVSRYECGKLAVTLELLSRASRVLDIPIEQVVGRGPAELAPHEIELLEGWRRLNAQKRRVVLELVRWGGEGQNDRSREVS